MDTSRTLHRLSVAGMVLFAAAYIAFIVLSEGNGPRLELAVLMFIHGDGGAWIVWCLIIATTLAAFFLRRSRGPGVRFFAAILVLVPLGWISGHILLLSRVLPNNEYWGYYLNPVMFRWMLVPWFAQYSLTLFLACLAIWAITRPRAPDSQAR